MRDQAALALRIRGSWSARLRLACVAYPRDCGGSKSPSREQDESSRLSRASKCWLALTAHFHVTTESVRALVREAEP